MRLQLNSPNYDKLAQETLDIMDRWDEKFSHHLNEDRKHERKKFRTRLHARIPERKTPNGIKIPSQNFLVWARNLSQAGVSFIYQEELKTDTLHLCLNSESTEELWYLVEIIRKKQVYNHFWDYGVQLRERITE